MTQINRHICEGDEKCRSRDTSPVRIGARTYYICKAHPIRPAEYNTVQLARVLKVAA